MKTLILVRPVSPYHFPQSEIKGKALGLALKHEWRSLLKPPVTILTSDDSAGPVFGTLIGKEIGVRSISTSPLLANRYFDLRYQVDVVSFLEVQLLKTQTLLAIGNVRFLQAAARFSQENLMVDIGSECIAAGEAICILETVGAQRIVPKLYSLPEKPVKMVDEVS